MTNHIKNMEWANVPYYKKQSIMREIYYDKYDFFYSFTVLYKKIIGWSIIGLFSCPSSDFTLS